MQFDLGFGTTDEALQPYFEKLRAEHERMTQVVKAGGYDDERASLNLPSDELMVKRVLAAAKPYQDTDAVVLVGMGGPGLGAKAVQEALTSTLHNAERKPTVLYADTVDPVRLRAILKAAEIFLKAKRKLIAIVATQSGGTTETIAGAALFYDIFKRHGINPIAHLPLVTNERSKLDTWGKARGFTRVLVPLNIGGRYSVFSPVGLFPLAVMGFDIRTLVGGARVFRDLALSDERNAAAQSAAAMAHHYQRGKPIHVTFLFSPELESLGLWCRQITAESLGKLHDREGTTVNIGITPTVAIGSRDLHSLFQLYMEGPNDKLTTFVRVETTNDVSVPKNEFTTLVDHIAGTSLQGITNAIVDGVLHAYRKQSRPYTVVKLKTLDPKTIGEFLQWKMMETMYLGVILNVNPFDQPGVEDYKVETKRLLAQTK